MKFNRKNIAAVWVFITFVFSANAMGAEVLYDHGHGALEIFDADGRSRAPLWVKIWLGFLMFMFVAGLLFVKKHPLILWAFGGFIVSASTGRFLFESLELPYLGGSIAIMHLIFWTPAVLIFLVKRPYADSSEQLVYRIWSGAMLGAIIFSFVFDVRDAAIYLNYIRQLA